MSGAPFGSSVVLLGTNVAEKSGKRAKKHVWFNVSRITRAPEGRKNGAKRRPRERKEEPNGAKMRGKIPCKFEIDFQSIFDAKIV